MSEARGVRDETVSQAAYGFFGGLLEGRYGKRFPSVYRGMEMGREVGKPIGSWDGMGVHN